MMANGYKMYIISIKFSENTEETKEKAIVINRV